jgi:hypothetical protein
MAKINLKVRFMIFYISFFMKNFHGNMSQDIKIMLSTIL